MSYGERRSRMPLLADPPQPTQASLSERVIEVASGSTVSAAQVGRRALRMTLPSRVTSSYWFNPVIDRLTAASALSHGWDSYDGLPTSYMTIERTLNFLASSL